MRFLLAIGLLAVCAAAQAGLVTFEMHGLGSCGPFQGCSSEEFEEDTGLTASDTPFDISAMFTIDTTNVGTNTSPVSSNWDFDDPGTGLSITIGDLTLFYGDYRLSITAYPSPVGVGIITDSISVDSGQSILAVQTDGLTPGLSEPTLEALITEPLDDFDRRFGDSVIQNSGWEVYVYINSIRRVPEPGTLALLCAGLLGLGFIRCNRVV